VIARWFCFGFVVSAFWVIANFINISARGWIPRPRYTLLILRLSPSIGLLPW